jgi:DnaJ-class molecular chaperone
MSAGMVELADERRKPVAVCTNCRAVSFSAEVINQPCRRMLSGNKRCKGSWGSALSIGDWESCPSCKGTGQPAHDDIVARTGRTGICTSCGGTGWIYVRDTPKDLR